MIDEFGIEAAVVPFDAYKTFQVPIAEITRLTTLTFTADGKSMSEFDPLKAGVPRRRRGTGRSGFEEAANVGSPDGYLRLDTLDSIRTTVE